MEIMYCDKCGAKVASSELSAGTSKRTSDGKIHCAKCAPLYEHTSSALLAVPGPAGIPLEDQATAIGLPPINETAPEQSMTKFYFCETCGKRITDKQILDGLGRDKKLKGVYCKHCAVGVTTMEFDAISTDDLRKNMRKSDGNATQEASTKSASARITSNAAIPSMRRTDEHPHKPAVHSHPGPKTRIELWVGAIAGGGVLAILGIFVLSSKPQTSKTLLKEERPLPIVSGNPEPIASIKPELVPTTLAPKAPPVPSPVPLATNDAEDRANLAYEELRRFNGLNNDDTIKQIERIDVFLTEYGDSIVSGRARMLRKELTAKTAASPEPAPVQPQPSVPPTTTLVPSYTPAVVDSGDALQKMLQQTLNQLSQTDIPAALRSVEQFPAAPADARNGLKSALEALQKRDTAWREARRKLAGQKIKIETKTGVVEGTVLAIEGDALKIDKPLLFDGVAKGSTTVVVAIADILPGSRETLAPLPVPANADEWMGQVLSFGAKQDFDAADTFLVHCTGHPLAGPFKSLEAAGRTSARETKAQAAWRDIESRVAGKLTQSQARTLLADIAKFETNFADTACLKDTAIQQKIVVAKDELGRLTLGLDPRVMHLFKGKVISYDQRTETITLSYDFATKEQTEDFPGSNWVASGKTPGFWPGLSWKQNELFVFCMAPEDRHLLMPQFVSNTLNIQFDYSKICDNVHRFSVAVSLFGQNSSGKSAKVRFLATDKGCSFHDDTSALKSNPAEILSLKDGKVEISCKGHVLTAIANGKTILEHTLSKPNDHTGFWIGGGFDSGIKLTKLTVSGRLDATWLKRALESNGR